MRYRSWLLPLLIGGIEGCLCAAFLVLTHQGAADFGWALRAARDLWYGHDPYAYPVTSDAVPYPLPAAFVAFPFALLPSEFAAGVFFGISSALLARCLLRTGEPWRLISS